jgi:hypothetical protein
MYVVSMYFLGNTCTLITKDTVYKIYDTVLE